MGSKLVLWMGAVLAATSGAAAESHDSRQIRVPLAAPEEILERQLMPADLTVLLDGEVQSIRQVLRTGPATSTPDGEHVWQVVVYFDAPLSTPDGLRQAALFLSRTADSLTGLGPTEIVLADPRPRAYLEGTRNPQAVKDALRDVRLEARSTGELLWHRQRFSTMEIEGEAGQIARSLAAEIDLIEQQRVGLLSWLADRGAAEPGLLILVHNGYDMNPRAFYSEQAAGSFLEDPRSSVPHVASSRAIAVEGWTVVCLALGPRPDEFFDPAAPLFELAHATGGEVVTSRREANHLLARIPTWPVLVVDLAAAPKTEALPFEVLSSGSQRHFKTRRWASVARLPMLEEIRLAAAQTTDEPRPVLQLLRPDGLTSEGSVRFRTITGRKSIHHVVFLLDGAVVAETRRKPHSAEIDLGEGVRPHTISAVAYSRSNRKLGEDSLHVNMALEPPRVTITELEYDPRDGILEIAAAATTPSGMGPNQIEIFLNDHQQIALTEPPYEARLAIGVLRPEDYVRVLAHYPTGETAEAARLPASTGPDNELDVNLVELLAMVTPRNRKTLGELSKSDFVIRQQGRPLPIDHFSHWQDLQLTLGLVLDTSDSMDVILEDAREAGERFFHEALRTGDEAFVVDFNNLPRLTRRTTADADRLLHSLDGLEASGMTALYDAIVFSLQQFDDTDGRRALVVLTDGEDSASYYQPRECVRQARMYGVPVYLIVLGSPPDPHRDPGLLRNLMIARRTGGEVYYISDLEDLSRIYEQIASDLRRQYFLAFNAGHTLTPEELQEIEIEVVPKGVTVRTLLASQQRGG